MSSLANYTIRGMVLCTLVIMAVSGCSTPSEQATIDPDTGKHPANWISDHPVAFFAKQDRCAECHGTNLTGGISGVSCFSAAFNGMSCHATGPGHPTGWANPALHGVAAEQDFSACKTCHGTTYQGGISTTTCYECHNGPGLNHPAPAWVVPDHKTAALTDATTCQKCHGTTYLGGGSHSACNSCHMENQTKVHMLAWYPDVQLNHRAYAFANGTASCANAYCHGTTLAGVSLSGPSCSTCHTWPITSASCGTCHGIPPTGTVFPNIAGRHSAHAVLTNIVCATCHQGAGSGTALHINNIADVIISAAYNAKTGTAQYYAGGNTCAKVSCHGGITTPVWSTGVIDVNTQCSLCHVAGTSLGVPEYNSQYSGRHTTHDNLPCYECHDTGATKLPVNHFTNLDTTSMTGAALTIIDAAGYSGGRCSLTCHNKEHTSFSW
jgi:predicted CxxxxCH...CXXCH cytochrome family protein